MRKMKVKNLRYWFYVHGNFKKEAVAIEDAKKGEAKRAMERLEEEAMQLAAEQHLGSLISASEKE